LQTVKKTLANTQEDRLCAEIAARAEISPRMQLKHVQKNLSMARISQLILVLEGSMKGLLQHIFSSIWRTSTAFTSLVAANWLRLQEKLIFSQTKTVSISERLQVRNLQTSHIVQDERLTFYLC